MVMSRLTPLLAGVLALFAPASALAAQSLSVTSATGFPAGGHPSYTTHVTLDTGAGTPSSVIIRLAPGVLASPSANPSCLRQAQHSTSCQIGTGSVTITPGLPLSVTAYLVPPPNRADVVGIDVVPAAPGAPVTHAGAQLVQTVTGDVQTVLELRLTSLGPLANLVTAMSLTVNGTLDGKPFNRMPTNCSPGRSSLTVAYTQRTETVNASPDFAPTGCGGLPYSPRLSGSAQAVQHGGAGRVVTTITQAAGEAASARTTLALPSNALLPNVAALGLQNTSHPVGSAVAFTPLLPAPLRGQVFLKGTLQRPFVVFRFPPPAALTLTGMVNLGQDSMTIPVVPDVPLTKLQVTFPGGPDGLLVVGCPTRPARLIGKFAAQSGRTHTSRHRLTVTGCPGASG
jgi:hypothetical protein